MPETDTQDVITVLTMDHRQVEELFAELERGQGSPDRRRSLVDQVVTELTRHSVAEERHLYPTVRRILVEGDQLADHELEEHAEAQQIMDELDKLSPEHPDFDSTLGRLIRQIRDHVEEEEGELFPQLEEVCSAEELADLGRKVQAAMLTAVQEG